MQSELSEFSYGFALTLEIVNEFRRTFPHTPLIAPLFPSLKDEGNGLGYDVNLRWVSRPIFLQFKRSEYLFSHWAKGFTSGHFATPYYRFDLRASPSTQHQDLLRLQAQGEEVYYAAPFFHLPEEFNQAFQAQQVFNRSLLIEPRSVMPVADGLPHTFCFNAVQRVLFSEPVVVEGGMVGRQSLERLISITDVLGPAERYAEVLEHILVAAGIDPDSNLARVWRDRRDSYVLACAEAAQALLGITMLLRAGPTPASHSQH